ncbi:MAG: cyclic pyranopterin monophosphate synthase MoaC, partial [Betaproteobacteria bacterium]|nr:cyclic pyranopterin monophosphate synthase MoaC [Betaproteobacteria bacterium]
AVARIAAISAAKKTAEWIPLCHILPLESVRVEFVLDEKTNSAECRAETAATAKTGVEMEALAAVQAGLLTIYDMLKSADRTMRMDDIRLLEKRGGKSGDFVRKK